MNSTFLFKTANNNYYLFDKRQKIFTNISQKQYIVFQNIEKGKKPTNTITADEYNYYSKKYIWLRQQGFFSNIDTKKRFSGKITDKNIKYQLANLKQLTFEVTDKCNLNCTYCAYGHLYGDFDERENKDLNFEDAKQIIDYLVPYINSDLNKSQAGYMYISFYGGEPLMGFNFIEKVISYVATSIITKSIKFSMTTNALLLHKHIDYLVEKNVDLLISLDGNKASNVYRVFHDNKSSYKKVIQNIDLVYKKYPKYFEKHVRFNSVLHNKNDEVSILSFFLKRYNKTSSMSPLNDSGIKEESQQEFNKMFRNINEYKLSTNEDYQNIRKDLFLNLPSFSMVSTFLLRNTDLFFPSIIDIFTDDKEKQFIPTGTCIPFSKKMFITVNRKIMICERIGHEYYAGKIQKNKELLDINNIVLTYNKTIEKLEKQCQNCYLNENCSQCMYYIEDLNNKPICKSFMNKNEYLKYLSSVFTYMEDNPEDILRIMNEVIID